MRTHQLKLADRQCRMSAISAHVMDAVVMLVTSLHGLRSRDVVTQEAADCVCRELKSRMLCKPPTDADFRQMTALGEKIAQDGWTEITGTKTSQILMPYSH
jgi:hypothetical protein